MISNINRLRQQRARRDQKAEKHLNRLMTSKYDDVALAEATEVRFLELCKMYLTAKGEELVPPEELTMDMMRWRQMRVRHAGGDYRHTDAELKSVQTIAEWTVQIKMVICEQAPKHVEWEH